MLFKQELIMQTGFFSISPTHKTTCTNNTVFPQNLHVINQEGKHITGFSFQLSNKKNRMHYYHFSHINFMQSNKENEHADWIFFFQIYNSENSMQMSIFHSKICMLFKQELIMQTGFFSISPAQKTTCTNNTVFPQNLHVIN